MSAPELPDRFDMPYAPDGDVRELFTSVRDWVTARGEPTFEGEMYGMGTPPLEDNEGDVLDWPSCYPVSSAPVRYTAFVSTSSLQTYVNTLALRTLEVADSGLTVMYDEPYLHLNNATVTQHPSFIGPAAKIFIRPPSNAPATDEGIQYRIIMDSEDAIASGYLKSGQPSIAPDGISHHEIKVHEHQALTELVRGLGFMTISSACDLRKAQW